MTIDEAIARAKEIADVEQKLANRWRKKLDNPDFPWGRDFTKEEVERKESKCIKCAEEHKQLAEWLEELKEYKATLLTPQMIEDLKKSEKQAHKEAIQNAMLAEDSYNKAIDDFVEKAKYHIEYINEELEEHDIDDIAEQLKEQE